MRARRFIPLAFCALVAACTATQDLGRRPGDNNGDGDGGTSSSESPEGVNPTGNQGNQDLRRKRVFVTSRRVAGTFGGGGLAGGGKALAIADGVCAKAAEDAKLGGKFVAWLSARDEKDQMVRARDRIPESASSWTLVDGKTVVFANREALFASTLTAIDQDEFGAKVPEGTQAWTGSLIGGGPVQRYNCNNWNYSLSDKGVVGEARPRAVQSGTQVYWAGPETEVPLVARYCDSPASFYCFEI